MKKPRKPGSGGKRPGAGIRKVKAPPSSTISIRHTAESVDLVKKHCAAEFNHRGKQLIEELAIKAKNRQKSS